MQLNGQQRRQFMQALLDAFQTEARLAIMLSTRLDINLQTIALGADLAEIIFKVIRTAEAEGWVMRLLMAAREARPDNAALFTFSEQFGLASIVLPVSKLEKIIRTTNSFLDVSRWRTRLGQLEAQVCRIEIYSPQGMACGTGFLLGPDIIITNYHVMETVIADKQAAPKKVILRFDYKQLADGSVVNSGTTYRLANDWLIDASPYGPGDRLPQRDQLDYVLLRVADAPGDMPIGGKDEATGALRKWIKIPVQAYDFQPDTPLFILQHPAAAPLKLALDTQAIISINANGTRVTYRTNTEQGSSGSPCFNSNWELVALHQGGNSGSESKYNEGIPFSAIVALLAQRGLKGLLDEQG